MHYLDFLAALHETRRPATYVEVGVAGGSSLALSRVVSVGIDPDPPCSVRIPAQATVIRATSDEYFARVDALAPFGGRPIELAFIDGMHWLEFALRDFRYIEEHASATTVVLFDDVFPRSAAEASRNRTTAVWAGDVWKIVPLLTRHRPDLALLTVNTEPTGTLAVLDLDRRNRVLFDRYELILEEFVERDPPLPDGVLSRTGALDPSAALAVLSRRHEGSQ